VTGIALRVRFFEATARHDPLKLRAFVDDKNFPERSYLSHALRDSVNAIRRRNSLSFVYGASVVSKRLRRARIEKNSPRQCFERALNVKH
jgi:hypothetical protein